MPIKIRLHGRLKDIVGKEEIVLDKEFKTIGELLEYLIEALGDDFKKQFGIQKPEDLLQPRSQVIVLVDGFSIKLRGSLDSPITSISEVRLDTIDVMEFFGGG